MKPYRVMAEDKEVRVEVIFKDTPGSGVNKMGNELLAKPVLGFVHFLRAILSGPGVAKRYEAAMDDFVDLVKKYKGGQDEKIDGKKT